MYDNSVKVPMIMSHPARLAPGGSAGAMTSQYDVMPTLLDYLGIQEPSRGADRSELPGTSFVRVLEGEAEEAREDIVVYDEYGPVRMIRTPEWKYVHRYPYGVHELYDLTADPDEQNNLVDERSRRPGGRRDAGPTDPVVRPLRRSPPRRNALSRIRPGPRGPHRPPYRRRKLLPHDGE